MSAWVLGMGSSEGKEAAAAALRAHPDYRKASQNMCLAALSMDEALAESALAPGFAMVLGTAYGELETTKEFLAAWARARLARPLLFQTSLHNATLGFLALQRGLTGPTFTVSDARFPGERALETAETLLAAGIAPACLVVAVDGWVDELAPALAPLYPTGLRLRPSAAALVLASERGSGARPPTRLNNVRIILPTRPSPSDQASPSGRPAPVGQATQSGLARPANSSPHAKDAAFTGDFSESDALTRLIAAMRAHASGELRLPKPRGGESVFSWEPA